ncbi:MAG: hypothetical protein V1914_04975 [archaeon]
MALEEKLNCEYVAKNIHGFLEVKTDYLSTFGFRVIRSLEEKRDPAGMGHYKAMQERTTERLEETYNSLDLDMKNKRGAYRFALCVRAHLPFWENSTPLSKTEFEEMISSTLQSGVESLREDYLKLEDKCVTINKDFVQKAYNWLLNEIYSETDKNKKVELLGEITISKEGDMLSVKTITKPLSKWAEKPISNTKWETWKK